MMEPVPTDDSTADPARATRAAKKEKRAARRRMSGKERREQLRMLR